MIVKWAKEFPKWAIALTIFFGSTTIFAIWWFAKKPQIEKATPSQPAPIADTADPQLTEPVPAPAPVPLAVEINPDTMMVGDRSLYQVTDSGIELVRKDWLDRKLRDSDQLIFLKKENLLVVGHADQSVSVHSTTGERIGVLALSSGGKFDGYLADKLSQAIFVKDGDMWRGTVEWSTATIIDEKQITGTGYFLGRPLQGRLIGATEQAMLYRDVRLGIIGVNLETGQIESGQLPSTVVPSPDGRIVIGDAAGRPAQLGVVDVDTLQTQTYPIPYRIPQGGLGWLSKTSAVIVLGNREIHRYDHESRKLELLHKPEDQRATVRILAQPSPDGKYVMLEDSSIGVMCLNAETGEAKTVNVPPMNAVEMLNDGFFLSSTDLPDSDKRGTWLGKFSGSEPVRIFAQPLVGKFESQRQQQRSSVPAHGSGIAVIKAFKRWYFINSESQISEVTVDEKILHPIEKN